jgi:hypothetical protein
VIGTAKHKQTVYISFDSKLLRRNKVHSIFLHPSLHCSDLKMELVTKQFNDVELGMRRTILIKT